MSTSKTIVLKSSDGENFEVEEAVALQSETIANMVEDGCVGGAIPLANVTGVTLAKVVEYCKKHVVVVPNGGDGDDDDGSSSNSEEELKNWDAEFTKNMDKSTLFELIMAANYLNIKDLLDLTCQTIANMIKDYSPDEARTFFNIEKDFSPEEEAEIIADTQWAYE